MRLCLLLQLSNADKRPQSKWSAGPSAYRWRPAAVIMQTHPSANEDDAETVAVAAAENWWALYSRTDVRVAYYI